MKTQHLISNKHWISYSKVNKLRKESVEAMLAILTSYIVKLFLFVLNLCHKMILQPWYLKRTLAATLALYSATSSVGSALDWLRCFQSESPPLLLCDTFQEEKRGRKSTTKLFFIVAPLPFSFLLTPAELPTSKSSSTRKIWKKLIITLARSYSHLPPPPPASWWMC